MSRLSRRGFLGTGVATVVAPNFLAACGPKAAQPQAAAAAPPLPDNPFLTWFGVDAATLRVVMSELTARGADWADLYFQHGRTTHVTLEDGIIGEAYSTVEQGVGLRCVIGDQVGYAFTEDLSLDAMTKAARTAAGIAKGGGAAVPGHFTNGAMGGHYQLTMPWDEVGIPDRLPLLRRCAELAQAKEPAVKKVRVSWSDEDQRVMVVGLDGRIQIDRRPMSRLWVNLTAEKDGATQSNGSNLAGRRGLDWYTEDRLDQVCQEAVDRTMILFEAKRPPAGELPVVLQAGASGILLHEAIGHGLEADFNRKGTSIYADKMGQQIAPDFVTIVDDATQDHERGALNVDDEGNPTEKTVLVEGGVLRSYLHDRISAKHYGVAPTGSGRRESYRHVVMPRMRSTYMLDGPHTRDEIIASVDKGIIAETFTNGQVQIGAGDFTFYIKNGWLIEGGKVTAPIKDCNIIGNGPDSLSKVTMAANDFKLDTGGWTCGKDGQGVPVSQGLPTVLVSAMTVGGTS
jgi:TldD protein